VWATSSDVGCAVHRCDPLTETTLSPATFLVCNYWPAGNYKDLKPYTKGPACSKCGSGAGWCKDKLCNPECSSGGKGCSCAAICYNCAKMDLKTCRCKCVKGWYGTDCKVRCEDTHDMCNANPGWPPSWCNRDYVQAGCPAMCDLCKVDPHAEEGLCEPAYAPGADTDYNSAQTTFTKNHQSMMILLMVIITFIINSYDTM